MFRLEGQELNIGSAVLDGYLDEGLLVLGIRIETLPAEGCALAPQLECESFLTLCGPGPISFARGERREFSLLWDGEEEPFGYLYDGEHRPLLSMEGSLEVRGKRAALRMRALCAGEGLGPGDESVSLEVTCSLDFLGLWMGKELEPDWEKEVPAWLDKEEWVMKQNVDGVFLWAPHE